MGKYRGLIIAIIVVVAIGGIGLLTIMQFPGLLPAHTIRAH